MIQYIRCKIKNIGVRVERPVKVWAKHLEVMEHLPNNCIRLNSGDTFWCLQECFECIGK